ncbi:MAG TPA: hypothetical protein DIT13_08115 [Verrucomicrobiales bacterium]|nr:hypothetical protein [Verrucomicrobiales bacterium]HRJ10444.1 hypothetical protein [Prosthecobacter sp.]HRK15675.1 hypothetical protein [Prosthecobacter sp.]
MTADENSWSVTARRFPRLRQHQQWALIFLVGIFLMQDSAAAFFETAGILTLIGLWLWLRRPGCLRVQPSGITFPCGLFIPAAEIEEISPSPAGWQIAFQHRGVLRFVEVREACFDDAEWPRVRAAFRTWHRTCS